ncbi:hypothetical protein B0H19DRAFT_1265617 [Mycena capillaripes]|nr:hypothetical protein B0H19DRAFT_1265617 [Mycena capillaripes]
MSTLAFLSENDHFCSYDANAASTTIGTARHRRPARSIPQPFSTAKKSDGEITEYVPPDHKPALNARSSATEVPFSHLQKFPVQRKSTEAMYNPAGSDYFPVPPIIGHTSPSEQTLRDTQKLLYLSECPELSSVKLGYRTEITSKMLRIRGPLDRNSGCKTALFECTLLYTPQELFQTKAYQNFPEDLSTSRFRWSLKHDDSRSLDRQHSRMKGVKATEAPEINADDWLDSPLAHAVVHYSTGYYREALSFLNNKICTLYAKLRIPFPIPSARDRPEKRCQKVKISNPTLLPGFTFTAYSFPTLAVDYRACHLHYSRESYPGNV